jgi:hypothetical protein
MAVQKFLREVRYKRRANPPHIRTLRTPGENCPNYDFVQTTWPESPPGYGLTTLVLPERLHYSNGTHRAPLAFYISKLDPSSRLEQPLLLAPILTCGGGGLQ